MTGIVRKIRQLVREYKTDKAAGAGRIPGWWDFTVDCGWSDKWYKCGNCDVCLHHRIRPNWDRLYNWGK
jgi:hypothetical protein